MASAGRTRAPGPAGRHCLGGTDDALVAALAAGDEATFSKLVAAWAPTMLRMARVQLASPALAEDVVQEAWLVVLRRLQDFEGRSSLRTWVLGIVVNIARARRRSERRSMPFSARDGDGEAVLEGGRFLPDDHVRWPQHWALGPVPWPTPEQHLLEGETCGVILGAIAALPAAQREVVTLRDIEGWSSEQTCAALGVSAGNQRVLLHRGRSRVRLAVEDYFGATERTT